MIFALSAAGKAVATLLNIYWFVVLAAVIVSWLRLSPDNPVGVLLNELTEPLLRPMRKIVPAMGGLDFTPILLLFAIQFLLGLLAK